MGKWKLKSQKGLTNVKEGLILIGIDQETLQPILMPVKTTSYLNINKNKAISELKRSKQLPKKLKKFSALTREEQSLLSLVSEDHEKNSWITIWDETSEQYINNKEEINEIETIIKLSVFFDMDYKNEDGKTMWEDYEIKPGDYLSLAYKLRDEKGFDAGVANFVTDEIIRVKNMQPTSGEEYYNDIITKEDIYNELKIAKEKLKEDSDEESEGI